MHLKVAILTANMGSFDPPSVIVDQNLPSNVDLSIIRFNDKNFPLRNKAMTPRLQARIPKMFGWEMAPGFDYYIWVDGSFSILNKDTVTWYLFQCQDHDIVMFEHPDRKNIKSEAEFIRNKIAEGNQYLKSRYENELIDEQLSATVGQPGYVDDLLIATCSFIYKNNVISKHLLERWWVHTSRYHIVDQLSIPYLVKTSHCEYKILKDDIYHIPYLTYTRNQKR
jgi:hypothetical protein